MLKRVMSVALALLLVTLGASPAHADPAYDFAVSVTATANTATVPSVITWHINVASVGDEMGESGVQEGLVEFTVPSNVISLVISGDCDTDGYEVTCTWAVDDNNDMDFEVHGLVSLLAVGQVSVTPAFTVNLVRDDSNSANDSDTAVCTVITSLLVTC